MTNFFHPITLIAADGRRVTLNALVDTGATFTTLPDSILRELNVEPRRQVKMRLADGSVRIEQLGRVNVELDGIEDLTYVVFGAPEAPPAIGALTLEAFLLGVDPVAQRLVPVIGWQV